MNILCYDSVIISDIHIGSFNTQTATLLSFLNKLRTNKLIINGDLFDSLHGISYFTIEDMEIIRKLQEISKNCEVIWIKGNHDEPCAEALSRRLKLTFKEELLISLPNKKVKILHGDIWDDFIKKHKIITYIADKIYNLLQQIDKSHEYARFIKRKSKTFLRCTEKVRNGAIDYCKKSNCDVIICGHTHFYETYQKEIEYYNSGCWTEHSSHHYIGIKGNEIQVIKY